MFVLTGDSQRKGRTPPDVLVAELANGQHGVVGLGQLLALGLSRDAIAHRIRVGRLHPVHRGVYAVGRLDLSFEGRLFAALLAVGEGAVVSHLSAAWLWGFSPVDRRKASPVDVTVTRRVRRRSGIRLHVVRALMEHDRSRCGGLAVTTPARTLLDLADVLPGDRALRRAVHEAQVQRRVNLDQLRGQLRGAIGRRGAPRLAAIVTAGPAPTRSELEDVTLELLRGHGFPEPEVNVRLHNLPVPVEVDFLFSELALVVEVDGARYHETEVARQADARKHAMLEAAGLRVIRLTWSQVTKDTAQTVLRLRRACEGQGARSRPP